MEIVLFIQLILALQIKKIKNVQICIVPGNHVSFPTHFHKSFLFVC